MAKLNETPNLNDLSDETLQEFADELFEAVTQTIDSKLKSWVDKTGCSSLSELRNSNSEEFEAHFEVPHICFASFVDCDCFDEARFDEHIRSFAVYN